MHVGSNSSAVSGNGLGSCGEYVSGDFAGVHLMGCGEGLPAPLIYRKGWALLGYLAVESGRMHSRAALATLLWPELSERSALTNLRQVLSNLNRYCQMVLGEGVLRIERSCVGLKEVDRPLFDIDLVMRSPCEAVRLLCEHLIFLCGMEDIAGVDFQSWLAGTRQVLEEQLMTAAEKCCDEMLATAQWQRAIDLARELSQRDPWNDEHARRLMQAHAGGGMCNVAVKVYQRFESALRKELGLDPEAETQRLLTRISMRSIYQRGIVAGMVVSADSRAPKLRLRMAG